MSKQVRSADGLLPKPVKPLKRLEPSEVVAVIRQSRDSEQTRIMNDIANRPAL